MKIIIDNSEDIILMEGIKQDLKNKALRLMELYDIDISKIPNEELLQDLLVELGRLCYEYRKVTFAIQDYKWGSSHRLDMDTNQFCDEEEECGCGCDCIRF